MPGVARYRRPPWAILPLYPEVELLLSLQLRLERTQTAGAIHLRQVRMLERTLMRQLL